MKPLTKNQDNLLKIISFQFGTKKARGFIPLAAIECYDGRSFNGLLARNLIKIDEYGRYKLVKGN